MGHIKVYMIEFSPVLTQGITMENVNEEMQQALQFHFARLTHLEYQVEFFTHLVNTGANALSTTAHIIVSTYLPLVQLFLAINEPLAVIFKPRGIETLLRINLQAHDAPAPVIDQTKGAKTIQAGLIYPPIAVTDSAPAIRLAIEAAINTSGFHVIKIEGPFPTKQGSRALYFEFGVRNELDKHHIALNLHKIRRVPLASGSTLKVFWVKDLLRAYNLCTCCNLPPQHASCTFHISPPGSSPATSSQGSRLLQAARRNTSNAKYASRFNPY